ncbi:PDGLE domain-containing protein [Janibacter terrae]|uniref:PDGLE domain-containing protein n=1 Tax=Janibacter terrae TaxID=103817 RepID=A0ABZ2FCJ5_9MICO
MRSRISTRTLVVTGLVLCLLLAGVASYYASAHPDGLEHVAGTLGFSGSADEHGSADSPFADYGTKGVDDGFLSGGLAGVVGVVLTGAVMWLVLRFLARRRD